MSCGAWGLTPQTEARMRSAYPKLTGMLVVDEVQPGSAADGVLAPGDILVAIEGKPVPEFFALEDVLDNRVGRQVNVEIQRGNETLKHALEVESLERDHRRRVHRVRRIRGAYALLPAGAALQSADQGRVRRQSRLCVRQRGHPARRADQLVQRQEHGDAGRFRERTGRASPTVRARRCAM